MKSKSSHQFFWDATWNNAVLLRFVITPLPCNVLIMGIVLMRRGPTWSILFGTIFGILPFALLVIMESTGHIRW
ncbi:hypothetical protein SH501x_005204 [Pirellulaceae bacterium SH501]